MKNKTVTIVCVILIIAALACFGYIFLNSKTSKKEPTKPKKEVEVDAPTEVQREERGQNVNVASRIGLQLRELIKYSEIYSNGIINELDQNGLTSKTKLLVALDRIYRKPEYQNYLEYSNEHNSTYILPTNMDKVLSDTFIDTSVTHENVDDILFWDENTSTYVMLPRGFASGTIGYTLEIPYKITQFSDRTELYAYRLYITKNVEMKDIESSVKIDIFYDKTKSINILTIENDEQFDENTQVDYLKQKIDDGQIDSHNLETVKYTFKEKDGEYKIDSFEGV